MKRLAGFALACGTCAVLIACDSEPELEFADWVFPVAEGAPIKEYAPVPLEDRAENVFELVEDLVIGGDPNDPNTAFFRPTAVVAAGNGNIFVVDSGNTRVQMFGPDGRFLKTLGRRGQGPGEFQLPRAATMAADHLVVTDMRNSRFSVWTDDGEHVADHGTPLGFQALQMAGLAGGGMMIFGPEIALGEMTPGAMPAITNVLASYAVDGEQVIRFIESAMPPMGNPLEFMSDTRARIQFMIDTGEVPTPRFAVGSGDVVYITPSSEYQVMAVSASGESIWALRVAWPRPPFLDSTKERRIRIFAKDDPDLSVDDFEWPAFSNAISSTLLVDGQGRLYVFPYTRGLEASDAEQGAGAEQDEGADDRPKGRPVDVYSPEGDLIVAGLASGTWRYAHGEYVYRLGSAPDSDETVVYRYRLVLNH